MTTPYNAPADLTDYAALRGIVITGDPAQLLQLAHDSVDAQRFKGEKTAPLQENEWPRTGVTMHGVEIPDTEIPDYSGGYSVIRMELETALAINAGNDPSAPIERAIKSSTKKVSTLEKTVEYMDNASPVVRCPKIHQAGGQLLAGGGGFRVTNGSAE